ncbi:DoxX family protein [Botrimarina sp.]|uniref:DoxX family protein n=1 Tax=Botrimarina sp. TaxID=2795802 RepID=UPI0032EFCF37
MIRLTKFAIVAVVALRLLLGWHFYNEGVKKLEPGFSSAGFLRTARGPLAPMFRAMVRGPYDAHAELAMPIQHGDSGAAEVQPGDVWLANIDEGWAAGVERLRELEEPSLSAETIDAIEQSRLRSVARVKDYIESIREEIADLQHDAWLLKQMRDDAGPSPPPYAQERIDEKAADNWRTMQPWISSVSLIENEFIAQAQRLAEADEVAADKVRDALAERSTLRTIDFIVTCVVLGCGICLFLGLATPVAAIVAAGFIFSVMLTLPPWVTDPTGGDQVMMAFFGWAIELMSLLVIAALGAGRWAGLDGVFNYLWLKSRGRLPRQTETHPNAASAAA